MISLKADNFVDIYKELLNTALGSSKKVSRAGKVRYVGFTIFELTNPRVNSFVSNSRCLSRQHITREVRMLYSSSNNSKYIPAYKRYNREGTIFNNSMYGQYINNQIERVISQLCNNRDTRQAIIILGNNKMLQKEDIIDVPCSISLLFKVNNNKLDLFVTMRSSDLVIGLPYDVIMFTNLQNCIAKECLLDMGSYYNISYDTHLYENDVNKLDIDFFNTMKSKSFISYYGLKEQRYLTQKYMREIDEKDMG